MTRLAASRAKGGCLLSRWGRERPQTPARRTRLVGSFHAWLALIAVPLLFVSIRAEADAPSSALLAAPTTSASAKPAPKPADKAAAKKLLAQGNQLVGEGDYVGALEKFRAAYDKFASPKILLNIGTTLRQLGRNVEAAEVYERYTKDPEHDVAREKDVERVLAEIDAVVGHIVVTVDDPAATLRLDGKQVEPFSPGESRRVEPGEHTLTAEKPGASPVVQSIIVKPRQEHIVNLRFAPPPPKQEPASTSTTGRTLGLALGGVGGVTLIAGVVVGFVAIAQTGSASSHCYQGGKACDQKGIELDQSAKTSATISTVGFAVGGGLLAAGALLFLLSPSPTKERPATPTTGSQPRAPLGAARRATATAPSSGPRWIAIEPRAAGASLTFGGAF